MPLNTNKTSINLESVNEIKLIKLKKTFKKLLKKHIYSSLKIFLMFICFSRLNIMKYFLIH